MKHNWKLECTIDAFVNMITEDNPKVKHLANIIVKCESSFFKYENDCFSEDEYSAMLPVLESEIHSIIRGYQYSHKLTNLMNPHLLTIWKRSAKWLAPRLGITETSAQQLKNTAQSKVWSMLNAAQEYLLIKAGREIPSWSPVYKDMKKYFKEN